MNYKESLKILHLNEDFSLKELKKKYHIEALKYHPDKTQTNTNEEFNKINEAYNFLLIYKKYNTIDTENENKNTDYNTLFKFFVSQFIDVNNIQINEIIELIIHKSNNLLLKFFEKQNTENCVKYFKFINDYNDLFNINNETLELIRKIVINKQIDINDNIIILNPKISDLFNNNIYKLNYFDDILFIPLWHQEDIYDVSNSRLIVKCIPELDDNITIDKNNNLYINKTISMKNIFDIVFIEINIGNKIIKIEREKLLIKKYQEVVLKNIGISKYKKDIYDINEKADIIVYLEII